MTRDHMILVAAMYT